MTIMNAKAMAERFGFKYAGREEIDRIFAAAPTATSTRRPTPVMEPWGYEVTPEAELSEAEYRSLFPPVP